MNKIKCPHLICKKIIMITMIIKIIVIINIIVSTRSKKSVPTAGWKS